MLKYLDFLLQRQLNFLTTVIPNEVRDLCQFCDW